MKRILMVLFVLLFSLTSLTACGDSKELEKEILEKQKKIDEQQKEIDSLEREVRKLNNEIESQEVSDNEKKEKSEEEPEEVEEANADVEDYDESQDNIDDIEYDLSHIVDNDLDDTDVTNIEINEDASVDEERYIVLIDLEWDVKNKPKTTKEMLDMYSDHLAAKLAGNELIHELVLFWEVPYHKEGDSILKKTYQNKEDGMYIEDEVKDTSVFK